MAKFRQMATNNTETNNRMAPNFLYLSKINFIASQKKKCCFVFGIQLKKIVQQALIVKHFPKYSHKIPFKKVKNDVYLKNS